MSQTIFKLADAVEWAEARAVGGYGGSAKDREDGYIHFSTTAQLAETARRHYAGQQGLVLAEIALAKLDDVRWEPSRGGDLFPHLYGELPMAAVLTERALAVTDEGAPVFDDGGSTWP